MPFMTSDIKAQLWPNGEFGFNVRPSNVVSYLVVDVEGAITMPFELFM